MCRLVGLWHLRLLRERCNIRMGSESRDGLDHGHALHKFSVNVEYAAIKQDKKIKPPGMEDLGTHSELYKRMEKSNMHLKWIWFELKLFNYLNHTFAKYNNYYVYYTSYQWHYSNNIDTVVLRINLDGNSRAQKWWDQSKLWHSTIQYHTSSLLSGRIIMTEGAQSQGLKLSLQTF